MSGDGPDARPGPNGSAAHRSVEAIARTSYGTLVAYLTSTTGDLAAAEDAMGEALVAALVSWERNGVPERPGSWLLTAARRNLVDAARRGAVARRALPQLARALEDPVGDDDGTELPDRRLHLMFACAHPAIDPAMHSPLMLQAVLGLDAARIAAAFLVPPATMAQRLVRVKAKIKQAGIPLVLPGRDELAERLDAVLDAVYAAYGLAWDEATADAETAARPLREEALWLARLCVTLLPLEAESHGLLALLLGIEARRGARRDTAGAFVPLDAQDTSRWSRDLVTEAERHLCRARELRRLGPFQLHAAIQSVHNQRADRGCTDWAGVSALYDGLAAFQPSTGVLVARAAARRRARGAASALALLAELPPAAVADYQPHWTVLAYCLRDDGQHAAADTAFGRAIALTGDPRVAEHLERVRTAGA